MPPKRTTRKKNISYASVTLAAGKGVESVSNEEQHLPIFRPQHTSLAHDERDSEIVASASEQNTGPREVPMEHQPIEDPPAPERPGDSENQLLVLRKKYKRTCSGLVKMHSHLEFIQKCREKASAPKGLRIKVKCNALLADFTDIGHRFKEIKNQAEEDFMEALIQHYELTTSRLETEKSLLISEMDKLCQNCHDTQTAEAHQSLLEKTQENILKLRERLEEKKNKKLESLDLPPVKRPKQDTPRRKKRVAALLKELLQQLPQRQPHNQQIAPPFHNAWSLQQPSLWGPCAPLGWQPPSLSDQGINGLLPQQPQLLGVGRDFHHTGRPH